MFDSMEALIKATRSYRSFKPGIKISEETLRRFVSLTRYTASSVNLQPLKYKICVDNEECGIVCEKVRYAKALKNIVLPPEGHEPSAYILIFLDKHLSENLLTFRRDIGIAAQTIMLCATEKGLGGCMIGNFDSENICNGLKIPDHLSLQLVIALGIPDEKVILEDETDGNVTYYRDEDNIHHVPKRTLSEILI